MRVIQKKPSGAWPCQALALLSLSLTAGSQAYEYTLDYGITGRASYDDNTNMKVDNPSAVFGGRILLPVELTVRGERLTSALLASVAVRRFDDSSYNSDDSNIQANAQYGLERGSVAVSAGQKRNSTQETQFLEGGEEESSASKVDTITAGGSGNYRLTEADGIIAGVNYSAREYENPNLINGRSFSGFAGETHQWTERTTLQLRGTASRYENDANLQVTSDSLGLQVGFSSVLTEQLDISFLGGWTNFTTNYSSKTGAQTPSDSNGGGYVVNGVLNYRTQRYTLLTRVSRRSTPSSNGYLLISNTLDMAYEYAISERTEFSLEMQGGDSNALDERINNDRIFGQAEFSLSYRLSSFWAIGGSYRLRYQDKESQDDAVYSNTVYFNVSYDPAPLLWSR